MSSKEGTMLASKTKKTRVLFLDDEMEFLELVSDRMRRKGYQVATRTNVDSALELVRSHEVNMVFLDFKMPAMDGQEVLTKIREYDKNIPVVIVTGYPDETISPQFKDLNISGLFAKTSSLENLERAVEVAVRNLKGSK